MAKKATRRSAGTPRAGGAGTSTGSGKVGSRSTGGVAGLVAMRTAARTASRSVAPKSAASNPKRKASERETAGMPTGSVARKSGSKTAVAGKRGGTTTSKIKSKSKRTASGAAGKTAGKAPARRKSPATSSEAAVPTRVVELEAARDERTLHRRIAERAYEIWRSRGGDEHANWLEAEREVLRKDAD